MIRTIVGNKKNEELFRTLVSQYGEGKWVNIARALEIHGIKVKKTSSLRQTWNKMNPIGSKWKLNDEEIEKLLKLGMDYEGNMQQMMEVWNQSNNSICDESIFSYTYWKFLKIGMMKLSTIFCRKKTKEKQYFKKMQYLVLKEFLKIPDLKTDDKFVVQIKRSSIIMRELIIAFGIYRSQDRATQYEAYTKITSKKEFELAVEHFKYFDMLKKISDRTYFMDDQIQGLCKFQAPTIIENRNSALYQLSYVKKPWRDMYDIVILTKDELTSDYLVNPLDKEGKVKLEKKVPKKEQQVQKVNIPKVTTLRGRINLPHKKKYQSSYSGQFHNDLIKDLDLEKLDICDEEEFDITQFQALGNKQQQDMDQEIKNNAEMKEFVDNYLAKARETAYLKYKQGEEDITMMNSKQ